MTNDERPQNQIEKRDVDTSSLLICNVKYRLGNKEMLDASRNFYRMLMPMMCDVCATVPVHFIVDVVSGVGSFSVFSALLLLYHLPVLCHYDILTKLHTVTVHQPVKYSSVSLRQNAGITLVTHGYGD
jgi:hypothetical protein